MILVGRHDVGEDDGWIVRLDSTGHYQYQKRLGGPNEDWLWNLSPTSDGGWILGGATESFGSQHYSGDGWVVKLDRELKLQWQKVYRGSDKYLYDAVWYVEELTSGGYQFLTLDDYRPSLTRLDGAGNVLWRKTYDLTDYWWYVDWACRPIALSDGGWVIAGKSGGDGVVLRVNATGDVTWAKGFEGKATEDKSEYIWDAIGTSDGAILMVGGTSSFGDTIDGWVVKLDTSGGVLWEYRYKGSENCYFTSVKQASDGAFILVGADPTWTNNLRLVRLSSSGKILLQKVYYSVDIWPLVQLAPDGGYQVIDDNTEYLYKIDKDGNLTKNCPPGKLKLVAKKTSAVITDLEVEVTSSVPKKLNFNAKLIDTNETTTPICE